MNSPDSLVGLERCARIPFWGAKWKPGKLKPVEMIEAGVRAGLMEHTRTDFGEVAGEEVYGLGAKPGIESKQFNQHDEVVHCAALADIVTCAIRPSGSAPWTPAPPLPNWTSSCFLSPDGKSLRRIVFVTSWNEDRHYSSCYSWESLGSVCHYGLPINMVVVKLGSHRDGRFHSFWSHGLLHPSGNKKVRFRKQKDVEVPFKSSWLECWREDRDDIKTMVWLQSMLDDGVLQDLCIRIDVPVPQKEARDRIVALAQKKLETVKTTRTLPDQNLSTCFWPTQCVFRRPCHSQEEPAPAYGFVQIDGIHQSR